MSNSLDSSSLEPIRRAALDMLRGQENPFESLARPQRLDDRFLDLHVPELLARERNLLLQVIDRYRVDRYGTASDLLPTRVVLVLGDRGAGKTHLLQSLPYRADGKSQILVRPSYFDKDLPFEEYLLSQLVTALVEPDEVYRSRAIEDLAPALTRRLLRQAIRALGPTDRIFALAPGRLRRLRLLLGGGDKHDRLLSSLADALAPGPASLLQTVERFGLTRELCWRLIQGHLRRFEVGFGLLSVLRREFYSVMARAALLGDSDPLFRFLEGEYTQLAGASTRRELVARVLHTLVEVCALVRQPVVVAFDNLELLFSTHNQFDGELTRTFWNVLAQAVDNTRGLLILLFAETGLLEKAAGFMDSFARDRLQQGVPIFAHGPVHEIKLQPPPPGEIQQLVHDRVRRALGAAPNAAALPPQFPFDNGFLDKVATAQQNLRVTLLRLRDEYSRLVYRAAAGREDTAIPPPPAPDWERILQSNWDRAGRSERAPGASHLQQLHAGLGALLQPLLPLTLGSWELLEVQPTAMVGDRPPYGVVSLLRWRRSSGSESRTVGVGFLLGKAKGMAADLHAKLDFFRRPTKGDELLILWPPSREGDDLVELLPAATRAVWDSRARRRPVTLRRISASELVALLAIPDWLSSLASLEGAPPPADTLRAFLKEQFQTLLDLLAPDTSAETVSASDDSLATKERVLAHED